MSVPILCKTCIVFSNTCTSVKSEGNKVCKGRGDCKGSYKQCYHEISYLSPRKDFSDVYFIHTMHNNLHCFWNAEFDVFDLQKIEKQITENLKLKILF